MIICAALSINNKKAAYNENRNDTDLINNLVAIDGEEK